MKKHVLFLFTLILGTSLAVGQIDTITSPFNSGMTAFDWSGKHWQAGASVIFEGLYNSTDADSTRVGVMHLHSVSWATIMASDKMADGVNGQAVDGVFQDTLMIPADFNLTADTAGWYLFQARVFYSHGLDTWSNGSITTVAPYKDSVAVDTVHVTTPSEGFDYGRFNLNEQIVVKGHYGIKDCEMVQISLMHLDANWNSKKEYIYDVYNPATGTGVLSGHINETLTVPSDFTTTPELGEGEFITLRVYVKYTDINTFSFGSIEIVDLVVNNVSLSAETMQLNVGASQELIATISPETAEDKSVSWSSSNSDVADVDANGLVTGMAVGTATITVTTTDGSHTASCDVNVVPVSVELSSLEMVNIYPNPASSVLNIQGLNDGTYELSIYGIHGAIVKQAHIEGAGLNSVSVEDLPKGVYFLDIEGTEGRLVKKFTK